jgi:hypothetical protein
MKKIVSLQYDREHNYFIRLEGARTPTWITPKGDIVFGEGPPEDVSMPCVLPNKSISRLDLQRWDEKEFQIVVQYGRGSINHTLPLGMFSDYYDAEKWVSSVNVIYERRDEANRAVTENGFRLGKFCTQPAIYDIIQEQENIIQPDTYLYSSTNSPIPQSGFAWERSYVENSIQRLRDYTRFKGEIKIIKRDPVPHDYTWFSNFVRYRREDFEHRITQPLELIFDRRPRNESVGVIPIGRVERFALLYVKRRTVEAALNLRPQELVSATFAGWLSAIKETATNRNSAVVVCTPTSQSVYYSVKNAVARCLIPSNQTDDRPTTGSLAEWLIKHYDTGVIACDIGVAYQIIFYLKQERELIANQLEMAFVPYENSIKVGLSYRVDDPKWGELNSLALHDTLNSTSDEVQQSLAETARRGRQIGMELDLAA